MINHHSALIYTMVLASAADSDMSDSELHRIGEIVQFLPVFRDYDVKKLTKTAAECAEALAGPNGLDETFELIRNALPDKLRETAYALACDVIAADGTAGQEELRLLEMIRHKLQIGRLVAAAIERGARARHLTV